MSLHILPPLASPGLSLSLSLSKLQIEDGIGRVERVAFVPAWNQSPPPPKSKKGERKKKGLSTSQMRLSNFVVPTVLVLCTCLFHGHMRGRRGGKKEERWAVDL